MWQAVRVISRGAVPVVRQHTQQREVNKGQLVIVTTKEMLPFQKATPIQQQEQQQV